MTANEKLYQAAVNAINALFSDQSVSAEQAKKNLDALRDEIDVMSDSFEVKEPSE